MMADVRATTGGAMRSCSRFGVLSRPKIRCPIYGTKSSHFVPYRICGNGPYMGQNSMFLFLSHIWEFTRRGLRFAHCVELRIAARSSLTLQIAGIPLDLHLRRVRPEPGLALRNDCRHRFRMRSRSWQPPAFAFRIRGRLSCARGFDTVANRRSANSSCQSLEQAPRSARTQVGEAFPSPRRRCVLRVLKSAGCGRNADRIWRSGGSPLRKSDK